MEVGKKVGNLRTKKNRAALGKGRAECLFSLKRHGRYATDHVSGPSSKPCISPTPCLATDSVFCRRTIST